jgi:pentapeptide repeat protein
MSVLFEGCSLVRATWAAAVFERSEMRGCDLDGAINPDRLRGIRMPWPDVVNSAGVFAMAAGVEIIDD